MSTADDALQFKVLGPLVATKLDGTRLPIRGPSQRKLLAALLLYANTVVPAERLADWCGLSPGGLRTAVSRLRRSVGTSAVLQEFPGYVLRTDEIDAHHFERLVKQARSAPVVEALATLEVALDLWDGDALADFADEPWARPALAGLNEMRAAAIEDRGELLLAVGRWTEAIVEMEAHIVDFPFRDRPRALLMRALAADGRQTEALRSYQAYRRFLAEEIGTEPDEDMQTLEAKIVAGWRDRADTSKQTRLVDAESKIAQTQNTGDGTTTKNADVPPGNLAARTTSFVGREAELKELIELARRHRLVTLTGIGGLGKTRLAIEVAAELVPDFSEGAWLIELAPVDDPGAVADVVASALGVTVQSGKSVTASVAEALAGKQLLLVLDNCEHVLEAATSLIEEVLATSPTVSIIATSREGTRLAGEHLWPVRPLALDEGARSPAVELFIDRAQAVKPGFGNDIDSEFDSVIEICRRLDGIPLAIELAAARMLTLTPREVAARLDDRFRLLSGSPRGPERHRTLRQAVEWSYDLLSLDEQEVFRVCAVFAGGFDLAAVVAVCERHDEFEILDALDSLVRKSLVTVDHGARRTRYSLLETIRHFAEAQFAPPTGNHAATDPSATDPSATDPSATDPSATEIGELRRRHAHHFATAARAHFDLWDGPGVREAVEWVTAEFDNLRVGFHYASDAQDLTTATIIAAHTPMIAFTLQRLEPVGWAEELLPAASAAQVRQLPRLYTAASLCSYVGRHEDALRYAKAAAALQSEPDFDPFGKEWVDFRQAVAELDAGRSAQYLEICSDLASRPGLSQAVGLCGLAAFLPSVGRADEAMEIAERAMAAASANDHPYWTAFAYVGFGRAFAHADPARALDDLLKGLAYAREHAMPYWEAVLAREAGGLEAVHGDPDEALELLNNSLESFHQAGNNATIAWTLASLAVLFDRIGEPEIAATIYGTTTRHPIGDVILGLASAVEHLQHTLGDAFDRCSSAGAAMSTTESVRYAQDHINSVRQNAL